MGAVGGINQESSRLTRRLRLTRILLMERTLLSSKGQVVIPKAVRDALHLEPGTEFAVKTMRNAVLLEPIVKRERISAAEAVQRLRAMPQYKGKTLSVEEMDAAISRRIRKEWSR
jgi:AbrB family looped-hinge helix DNA binding protein